MLDLIVLHGEFSLFTVRGNFWYQIYRNRRKKVLCSRLSLITLTNTRNSEDKFYSARVFNLDKLRNWYGIKSARATLVHTTYTTPN